MDTRKIAIAAVLSAATMVSSGRAGAEPGGATEPGASLEQRRSRCAMMRSIPDWCREGRPDPEQAERERTRDAERARRRR